MKAFSFPAITMVMVLLTLPACHESEESHKKEGHENHQHKILVTSPIREEVTTTQQYVCQIHSRNHIEVKALEGGYLEEIPVKEGQAVKKGDLMFKILFTLYKAKLESKKAEAQMAQIEYDNSKNLLDQKVVSSQELALAKAKLDKAQAEVQLSEAELDFTNIKAPFDGIIDRLREQTGSLIEEGDVLTTLSDNSLMWVYFNVPEARYLEYKINLEKSQEELSIALMLANGSKFDQPGKIGAIEADFNNTTGNIAFRADFPNPTSLLRHGQTGTIIISRKVKDALVIPQRATYEILARKYVYVVDKDDVVHQRDIVIESVLDDIYIIKSGLDVSDKIILEGVQQVRDGEKVEYEFLSSDEVLGHLKYKAE
jgi:membrane fusion protein (multidrug efflux system)